jgi:hypothetical protein
MNMTPTFNRGAMQTMTWVAIVAGWFGARAPDAVADRYEATVVIRTIGAVGRATERVQDVGSGDAVATAVYGGGGELGLSYGLRNWLDVGGEVVGAGFGQATYDPVSVPVTGSTAMGRLTRTTRILQLRGGATLRLGVGWVPILHLGLGLGARVLSAATLLDEEHAGSFDVTPDGMNASVAIDIVANARVGLEHRLDRRWTMGVTAEATHAMGFGTQPLDIASIGVSLSYTWYPVFSP